MVFQYADEEKTIRTFQRTLNEFRVDDQKVTASEYHKALEGINIFIKVRFYSCWLFKLTLKARNFLVYQGAVEQIAMQNPKELTQLFEDLSKWVIQILLII